MLTGLHYTNNYSQERYNFLKDVEGYRDRVYVVPGENIATIGVGINLNASDANLNAVLQALGFDLNGTQLSGDAWTAEQYYIQQIRSAVAATYANNSAVQTALDAIMQNRAADSRFSSSFNRRTIFRFNDETESKNAFDAIIPRYEARLNSKLGYVMPESKERAALVSLSYNTKTGSTDLLGPNLIAAITNDNRAEAWFEIRYNSNKNGIHANRRYKESYLFGLYDVGATFTDPNEAKEVMRMYTSHQAEILSYEQKYSPSSAGFVGIKDNLKDAKDYLIANFVKDVNIDGEVIVGKGLSTYEYKDKGLYNDKIIATAGNDLIFGERGEDTIWAGAGEDVVYGGKDKDYISGGAGNDILNGGEGKDTYYYRNGDGNDKIVDTGENTIIIEDANGNKRTITNVYKTGAEVWTTADGKVEFTHHSPWQLITEDGSTIELGENFQDGDFGIRLLDTPANPVTTNTITGNADANILRDTAANDRIEGGSGNDGIWAGNGGANWLLGGEGNDAIISYDTSGADIIEGGSGVDVLAGGTGDDQVFGENKGEMDDIIADGEVAQSINQKGDLLSGGGGNDLVYGTGKKDALFGGKTNILLKMAA
jgi:Ca2+-binding RTX toxin-like protein